MAGIAAAPGGGGARCIAGLPVVIAGYNGPEQTVVAGPVDAVEQACRGRRRRRAERDPAARVARLPLAAGGAGAADAFGGALAAEPFGRVRRRVVSTVTGDVLAPDTDVPALLRRQITDPVLFAQAVELAAKDVDLLVEVGPGRVLSGLAAEVDRRARGRRWTPTTSRSPACCGWSARPTSRGVPPVDERAVPRPARSARWRSAPSSAFFASPCEQAPQ